MTIGVKSRKDEWKKAAEWNPNVVYTFRDRDKVIALLGDEWSKGKDLDSAVLECRDLPDMSPTHVWNEERRSEFAKMAVSAAVCLAAGDRILVCCGRMQNRAPSLALSACALAGVDPGATPKPIDPDVHCLEDCASSIPSKVVNLVGAMTNTSMRTMLLDQEQRGKIFSAAVEAYVELGDLPASRRAAGEGSRRASKRKLE